VNGVDIPWELDIQRPAEEYSIHFTIMQIKLNTQLANDQFNIQIPPGSQLVRVSDAKPIPNPVVAHTAKSSSAGEVRHGVSN
jgi:hypothetical protein